jgi:hypothetical protein
MVGIGSIWLRIGTGRGLMWTRWWTSGFYKMLGSSRVAAQLEASQEGLSSMSEWVSDISQHCQSNYLAMAIQPFTGPLPLFSSVELLGDQPVARPLPMHRINVHRHPCLEWDSNPRSQCSSGRIRFMRQTARPLWSASGQLTVLNVSALEIPQQISRDEGTVRRLAVATWANKCLTGQCKNGLDSPL